MCSLSKRKPALIGAVGGMAILLLTSCLLAAPGNRSAADQGQLIVHEWGTFLSVQGSDGVTLGGMVDSDEVLPSFVEQRGIASWQRANMFSKMETPVTYFYTDRPRDVQVRVDMPKGVLTHWFPNVCRYGPKPSASGPAAVDGYLDWCSLHLIPENHPEANAPYRTVSLALKNGQVHSGIIDSEDNAQVRLITGPYSVLPIPRRRISEQQIQKRTLPTLKPIDADQPWRFARQTDATLVRKTTYDAKGGLEFQFEKFLFYRGLGTFQPPLEVSARGDSRGGVTLAFKNRSGLPLQSLFAIQVQGPTIQFAALNDLSGNAARDSSTKSLFSVVSPLDTGVPEAKRAVAAALVKAGLYAKEADAMVNTWERSYFRTDGLRILYVLPRETVDQLILIRITPTPDNLVRVMVGRLEVLTPDREHEIEKFVADLGAPESATRAAASAGLARLGRLGEPALRRVVASTKDPEVLARARTLLERFATPK